jgi:hypothetical protein
VLLALALAALALAAAQHLAGAPFWHKDFNAYPLTLAAALLLAARELWPGSPRRPVVAAGLLSFALFVSNTRHLGSGDTAPSSALPFLVVRHGTLSLDPLPLQDPLPYWVAVREGRRWSQYPVAAGVLALPVFLPVALGRSARWESPEAAKIAASIMAALAVALVLATLLRLGAPRSFACLVTALFAAGSPMFSTASQALWQHAPGTLGIAGMLWALVRARERPGSAWIAGAFAGLACAARPSDVLVVAPFWTVLALESRPRALRFAVTAAIPIVLVALYNSYAFGAPWRTGYDYTDSPPFEASLHVFGLLFSPTRGLFLYVPWAAIALAGAVIGVRRERLHVASIVAASATVLLYSAWSIWWGGWCFGPRLLCDLMPLFAIACVPLADPARRWAVPALAATGAIAIGLHSFYAFGSGSRAARLAVEMGPAQQTMEWCRYPLFAPFTQCEASTYNAALPERQTGSDAGGLVSAGSP